jgi:hypothetical protein
MKTTQMMLLKAIYYVSAAVKMQNVVHLYHKTNNFPSFAVYVVFVVQLPFRCSCYDWNLCNALSLM